MRALCRPILYQHYKNWKHTSRIFTIYSRQILALSRKKYHTPKLKIRIKFQPAMEISFMTNMVSNSQFKSSFKHRKMSHCRAHIAQSFNITRTISVHIVNTNFWQIFDNVRMYVVGQKYKPLVIHPMIHVCSLQQSNLARADFTGIIYHDFWENSTDFVVLTQHVQRLFLQVIS